ncbi:acyl-CoA mutase large subunit family protein [Aquibacillus rhizosphaerae]|uniref:Methylmalonyl-CoA mutase family protein n=1 Tax=Aquibacillus rhizosphaerae TaxID=3051431 RepID=A0ABT7L4C7_9BACI|nr:methylmalonyl-CoA mutase family protein [Aquibacillus sp. LR5S19]MDL4840717.1 methylmalonyl-CoA mutase family protein [Aquibacillus sp. LR5S19]
MEKNKNQKDLFHISIPFEKQKKLSFYTDSSIPIEKYYNPINQDNYFLDKIGYPGKYPYTRGIHPTMYRQKLWTIRQYAGFGSAYETNERFRYLLKEGQNALSVAFDLPTQLGYDSDHPLAEGEVGKVGVAIDTLHDMEKLFNDIRLDHISTSMTINAPAIILYCMYIAIAEKQGLSSEQITGTVQNDILKEYIARGTYIFPPKPSIRLTTDLLEYSHKHTPKFNSISISGYHIRESGSNAIQELAFTFANAMTYIDEALRRGIKVDEFASRLSFFFSASNDFFEEIAKFRAARRIWATIMKKQYQAKEPKCWQLRFHTQTAGSTLTKQDPDNNIIRVTLQALSAVLGGTQSLHTNAKDEASSLPNEDAAKTALRTQQIIAFESGVGSSVDPLGGSYYVEYLTNEIEKQVYEYINEIQRIGGTINAIETGYFHNEIQNVAYETYKQVENKEKTIVGVNKFDTDTKRELHTPRLFSSDHSQINSVNEVKKRRNELKVTRCLSDLRNAITTDENLVPFVLAAVKSYCTVGEICHVFREVFGSYSANEKT